MSETVMLTHKAWFGLCPIYMSDPDDSAPLLIERHWLLLPLFIASETMFALVFKCCTLGAFDFTELKTYNPKDPLGLESAV